MDIFKVLIKRLKSHSKTSWEFNDYPTKTWKNPNARDENIGFGAGIINWPVMVAHGESPEKALSKLEISFNLYKVDNDLLPRPGTKVPLQFASTENIDRFEKTAVDFFKRVLNMNFYEGFYSDGTILAYFEPPDNLEKTKEMKANIINKTLLLYNVDITDIYDEEIWRIFDRIENNNLATKT